MKEKDKDKLKSKEPKEPVENMQPSTGENNVEAAPSSDADTGTLQSPESIRISALELELSATKDKYLRVVAEYDNFRKRSTKEKSDAYTSATTTAVTEVLSVVDNFERALACDTTDEIYKDGIQMIFNQYQEILKRLGVEEIEAQGKPFDPTFHNAVNKIEDENFDENTVCQVFQKGYRLGDKVIRYAMVVVAN